MSDSLASRLLRAVIAAPIMFYIVYQIAYAIGKNQQISTITAVIVATWIFYTIVRYPWDEALKKLS